MSGRHFGHKWRFQFEGWFVECFEDPAPEFTRESGVKIQAPASRLQVIRRILALPPTRWTEKKHQRLAPLVEVYESLIASLDYSQPAEPVTEQTPPPQHDGPQ